MAAAAADPHPVRRRFFLSAAKFLQTFHKSCRKAHHKAVYGPFGGGANLDAAALEW